MRNEYVCTNKECGKHCRLKATITNRELPGTGEKMFCPFGYVNFVQMYISAWEEDE